MFTRDIGIDLGTANTRVCVRSKGVIMKEPSVVAYDVRNDVVKAVGTQAKEMIGRTPGSIVAVKPLKDGVIADFDVTAAMLKRFIRYALRGSLFSRARVMISVPTGVTEVESRAVYDAAKQAGATDIDLIEEPIATAIGAGLKVNDACGCMIVDIGGGTTETAVISLGGIVTSQSVRVAGDHLDEAIIDFVRKKHNLLIGERTAEDIKIKIGSALPYENEEEMQVKGRNIVDGLPNNVVITAEDVREALKEPVAKIVEAVCTTLEKTPPELSSDIIDKGMTLAGGSSQLRGIDKIIADETGIPVNLADKPTECMIKGMLKKLESGQTFENYDMKRNRRYR